MERLKKHSQTLKLLQKAPPAMRKSILQKASPELIRCICDCSLNVLKANVPLSACQIKTLRRHKTVLRQLADKKVSLAKKRKLSQKGGFLPALIGALAPVLGGILSSFAK